MTPTDQALSLSGLLRRYRLAAGLSQEALAERAGLSIDAVSSIERGLRRPRRPTVQALGHALALSPVQIATLEVTQRRSGRPRSVAPPPGLPVTTTPVIGREHDVAIVSYLLRVARERLLTLTGTGGVGKTRLAQQSALEVADAFADGVFWVDLAPLRDQALVAATIARQVGVLDSEAAPLQERLVTALRPKRLLLVLDNFEQVLGARTVLERLLAACPGVGMLVTSRMSLGVVGEQEYVVAPLRLPGPTETTLQAVAQTPAVALFVQRARATEPSLVLTGSTAPIVTELCRRFDGLPLAIELAARLVRVLPPAVMLDQISRKRDEGRLGGGTATLDVLTGGGWALPDRQQTLRTALAWSYDLLATWEQALFRRVCVFAGVWTLEAAAAVGAPTGADSDGVGAARAGLAALVAQSLVHVTDADAGGEERYGVLETVREYGLDRLEASGEMGMVQERRATWYLRLAEQAEPELTGPDQGIWLARLEWERDNLRGVLGWARDGGDADLGLRLAVALRRFWSLRGYLGEGRLWLEVLVAMFGAPGDEAAGATLRASAWYAIALLARDMGDYERAVSASDLAITLYRGVQDQRGVASTLNIIGHIAKVRGDTARASAIFAEAVALHRALGDAAGVAMSLINQGNVLVRIGAYESATQAYQECLELLHPLGDVVHIALTLGNLGFAEREQGHVTRAAALQEESLALRRTLGDKDGMALALDNLGVVAHDCGDLARATTYFEQALFLYQEIGQQRGTAVVLAHLAAIAVQQGRRPQAAELCREALEVFAAQGDKLEIAACLEVVMGISLDLGEPERAAWLGGAAAALRAAMGAPPSMADRRRHEHAVAALRSRMGDDAFEAAWATGTGLSLAQAIVEANTGGLAEPASSRDAPSPGPTPGATATMPGHESWCR